MIKPQTVGVQFCDGANPIYISKDDALTEETEREILIHNTLGERICDWGRYFMPRRIGYAALHYLNYGVSSFLHICRQSLIFTASNCASFNLMLNDPA
ncbi:hypothetical protein FMJ55_24035 [Klebsiella pneumoniae]|nr:hypothetical protein [Klebsiella pneumoniae]